jgi:hypothetical protein
MAWSLIDDRDNFTSNETGGAIGRGFFALRVQGQVWSLKNKTSNTAITAEGNL